MLQRLVRAPRSRARRCSRRCRSAAPLMRPGTASGEPRHGRRAVGAEHELRRLDLHLEPEPPVRAGRARARAPSATSAIASTCATVDTFGRVSARPSGSPPCSMSAVTNRSSVRMPRARVGASNDLNRMPMNGGAKPRAGRGGDALGGAHGVGVLDVVAAVAVAVFEVDAQVLDRLDARASRAPAARPRRRASASMPDERRASASTPPAASTAARAARPHTVGSSGVNRSAGT